MKVLISKLKKEFKTHIFPTFHIKNNLIESNQEKSFYSISHYLPNYTIKNNSYIEVPLDLLVSTKKNLMLKYKVVEVDSEKRDIFCSLNEWYLLPLVNTSNRFSFNIGKKLKNKSLEIDYKVLLLKRFNKKVCSRSVKKEVIKQTDNFLSTYNQIIEFFKASYNKTLASKLTLSLSPEIGGFVKTIVITGCKKIV